MNGVLNVLVVVDVQNCFTHGGSLGNEQLKDSIEQIKEIIELINQNDVIVFSRDMHPINHKSVNMNTYSTTYDEKIQENKQFVTRFPEHCRDNELTCDDKNRKYEKTSRTPLLVSNKIVDFIKATDTNEIYLYKLDKIIPFISIIGTELSYLYLLVDNPYLEIFKKFIMNSKKNLIGISPDYINKDINNISQYNISHISFNNPLNYRNKEFIQLAKGQLCNYESFSAFNYHIRLNDNKPDNDLEANSLYTTGLFEFIIQQVRIRGTKTVNITVCGLVGNICVMNTVHQGLAMLESYKELSSYKDLFDNIEINFVYSTKGTLFLPIAKPNIQAKIQTDTDKDTVLKFLREDLNKVSIFNGIQNVKYIFRHNNEDTLIEYNNTTTQEGGTLDYKNKYQKYKSKYLELKKVI